MAPSGVSLYNSIAWVLGKWVNHVWEESMEKGEGGEVRLGDGEGAGREFSRAGMHLL